MTYEAPFAPTRRTVLTTGLATATALSLPTSLAAHARWTRKNVNSTGGAKDLATYKTAVGKLLALPASDPRNWYRMAVTHLLDCPHRNWWFFNWHRPFVGYLEQICREVTGENDFAMPYWDWSADQALPDPFWKSANPAQNILDPGSDHFLEDRDKVMAFLDQALTDFWNGLSVAQKAQIAPRSGVPNDPIDSANKMKTVLRRAVFSRANARGADANVWELVVLQPFGLRSIR